MKASSILAFLLLSLSVSSPLFASCSSPANPIEAENCLPGVSASVWDVDGAGDQTIQGFATDISVNAGNTITFKIKTGAKAYTIDIYRMGYYSGMGARLIASIQPSAILPQAQPPCLSDTSTGLVDCGNWSVSASWAVPASAVSGIYFAHLTRTDTGGDSHIVFVVRNDSSNSAILFQTADETWQAYNGYGGSSLYGPDNQFNLTARSFKVSYNRPFDTRGFQDESATWVFGAEYPMVRFLEANGYDVSYSTGIDAARHGDLILNHKVYLTAGHDEYWSGPHRVNVEKARDAGVNMAFFSGNEVFWKTRLESSIDGSNTPNRTLVCYKETLGPNSTISATAAVDPEDPPTWTGTWRDPTKSPPADGGRPENSLTGTLFSVNGPGSDNDGTLSIKVPYDDGRMRFWRNTTIANLSQGSNATLPKGTLGYEWDVDSDNGARPAGIIRLSTSTYTLTSDLLLDQGGTYGAGAATHHLTLYRAQSGALVFGAGTIQWSWGLDSTHDNPFFSPNSAPNTAMRQATINLLADMGVQPATLQAGLLAAAPSTDTVAPSSVITWPTNGSMISTGSTITISGTASDSGGGVVGGVEVSLDGGTTWHPANGRENWTYSWTPTALGSFTLLSRATDDSANTERPAAAATVVTVNPHDCPCSEWASSTTPSQIDSGDSSAVEVGVRFRSDFDGYVTGVRFYKATTNVGTHIGSLWSNTGTLLARAIFTNETASGWQQVTFSSPVPITANTTYVASYFAPSGHYSATGGYFANQSTDDPPIHLLANDVDGLNGVYGYNQSSTFPTASFNASNYWVDIVYVPAGSMPGAPPALLANPSNLSFVAYKGAANPNSQTVSIYNEGDGTLSWTASSNASWLTVTQSGTTPGSLIVAVNSTGLNVGTYNGTITVSSSGATNLPQTISVSLTVTNLLLFSDFSNGKMDGWAFSPLGFASGWSVGNGALQYNGGGHTQVYAGNSAWTDYGLAVAVKLATLNDYPGGIRGRVDPITGAGYAVWLYPAEGVIRLFRNVAWDIDSGFKLLGQSAIGFDTTNFHSVVLSFQGNQIQVSYDSNVVISASDSTYPNGLVALDVSNQVISFTKILVTSANANAGSLSLNTNGLSFAASYQTNPSPQTVQLSSTGGTLAWTAASNAPWLAVTPSYGSSPASLQISAASSSLLPGTYSGVITAMSLGSTNTTQAVNVNLIVAAPAPVLAASPANVNLIFMRSSPAPTQTIAITNGAPLGSFNWTASSDSAWLTLSASSGSTPSTLNLLVNPASLANGTYTANVTINAAGVANSPATVPVTLQVLSPDLTENFADQGLGWITSPMGQASGWTASNGIYSYAGFGLSQSCTGNAGWSDYTFDTNVRLSNLSNWPGGIRGRVNPSTGAGYVVWLYPAYGEAILYRVPQWDINGPGLVQLATAALSFDAGVHDLRMDFRGNVITIFWDGAAIMAATDATYLTGFVCLDADNQPIAYSQVSVAAVQGQAALDPISPSSLVFSSGPGAAPVAQVINVSAGGAVTAWSATSNVPWMTATASSALTPGTLTVFVNASGLADGTYSGSVRLSVPGSTSPLVTIPVTLAVKNALLSVTPTALAFFGAAGLNPSPQSIHIANAGTGTLNWTAGNASSWIALSSVSGTAPAVLSVSIDTAKSGTGAFSDTIAISSADVSNSPVNVPVSLEVGSLLFRDDFTSGSASNWAISPLGFSSGWSVTNGTYFYSGIGHTQSYAGSSAWTDYTVAADIQLSSLNDYPGGLRGRVNTGTGASYGVWIYPAERVLKLFRIGQWNIDTDLTLLGQSVPLPMDTNWHNVRMAFRGSSITVYFDNSQVISASDSSYSQGAVALDVSNQPIAFDNVTVISLP